MGFLVEANAFEVKVFCQDERIQKDGQRFFEGYLDPDNLKKSVSQSIKRFYYRWPIENIIVKWDEPSLVSIQIIPDFVITDIQIKGNKRIKRRNLVQQVRIFENAYKGSQIQSELEKYLVDYYAFRGFPNAGVNVLFATKSRVGSLKLTIEVQENDACQFNEVLWNDIDPAIKHKMTQSLRSKLAGRCDQELLMSAIKEIEEKYRNGLYRQISLKTEGFSFQKDGFAPDMVMNLFLGPQIDIQFHGNTFYFERDELLKKSIFLDQERKFNEVWLETTAVEAIQSFYNSKGYPFAKVKAEKTIAEPGDLEVISFYIQRGPIMRLRNVQFQGNVKMSNKKLESMFFYYAPEQAKKRIFVQGELDIIVDRLIAFYQSNGFLRMQVQQPGVVLDQDNHAVDIIIDIRESDQTIIQEINIQGNETMTKKQLSRVIRYKKGDPLNPVRLRDQAKELQKRYQTLGYKYAKVTPPNLKDVKAGEVIIPLVIEQGPKIQYGDIIYRGNDLTKPRVIRRELEFKEGQSYNPFKIERSRSNLLRLGFFQSVTMVEKPRDDQPGVEDIIIQVRERKQRMLVARPGISTDDGYRFASSLGYTNIAGTGRSATLSGRINRQVVDATIVEHRLIFTYLEPSIINFFDGKVSVISEKNSEIQFDIERKSLILGAEKFWTRRFRTIVQWELESRDPFNIEPDVILSPLDQTQARFGSISSIVDIDLRDNILNAERGTFHRLRFDLFDQSFLSNAEFYRLTLINNFYIPIYRRFRTVLALRLGFADTYGKTNEEGIDQIPIEKRFRLGGNNSLRGFSRNCVGGLDSNVAENCSDSALLQAPGGNSMFNVMYDILIPITETIDFVLFTDAGNAFLTNGEFDLGNIRHTFGFGLRYNTFVGPLRIDYGIKLDRRTGEARGQLHFAVGQF